MLLIYGSGFIARTDNKVGGMGISYFYTILGPLLFACGNYLIMSDVGAAKDLILDDRYGHILRESKEGSQNEEIMMQDCVSVLKNIVDGKVNIYENLEERIAYFNEYFTMENIIKQQCFQEWIG